MPIHVRDNRGGNWFWIHNAILDHFCSELGPYGFTVYATLCRYAGQDQCTWVAQKAIATTTGISKRQVERELQKLKTLGLLEIDERHDEHGQVSNIYTLLASPLASETPPLVSLTRGGVSQSVPLVSETSPPRQADEPIRNKTQLTRLMEQEGGAHALQNLWQIVLADLAEQMVPSNFRRWLARTCLLSQDAGAAVVGVPDQVSADQLARRLDPLVRRALAEACGEAVAVQYRVIEG